MPKYTCANCGDLHQVPAFAAHPQPSTLTIHTHDAPSCGYRAIARSREAAVAALEAHVEVCGQGRFP